MDKNVDSIERYNKFIERLINEFYKMKKAGEFSKRFGKIVSDIYKELSERSMEDSAYISIALLNRKEYINKLSNIEERLDRRIRKALYNPLYNASREKLRERWISLAAKYNRQGESPSGAQDDSFIFFNTEKLNHLKIYLTNKEKNLAEDIIRLSCGCKIDFNFYLTDLSKNTEQFTWKRIQEILLMEEWEFGEFIADSPNLRIKNLEKMLSSFSTSEFKIADKSAKIRMLRDIRFGRTTLQSIRERAVAKRSEIADQQLFGSTERIKEFK
jgi:hypothetical protein